MIPLTLCALALANPSWERAALAPSYPEYRAEVRALTHDLLVASALEEAVARAQNAWVEAGARPPCGDDPAHQWAAQMALFGASWRDAVQRAVTRRDALARGRGAETLAPLLTAKDQHDWNELSSSVLRAQTDYLEAVAWQGAEIEPALRCALHLAPHPGNPRAELRAVGEQPLATAIALLGEGYLCENSESTPASGVIVVAGSRACYSRGPCACTPVSVAPGAALLPQ